MEHKDDGDTNHNLCSWNDFQSPGKETEGIEDQKKKGSHLDHSTVKIS